MEKIYKQGFFYTLRYLILIIIIISFLYFNQGNELLTIQKLFDYSPNNLFLAMLFMLALYGIKPIVLVLPVPMLQIVVGMIFSPFFAFLVNTLGLVISCTVAYGIGLLLGKDRVEKLMRKFKKSKDLKRQRKNNEEFFVFIIRAIGLVSMDVTGMFFGSVQTPFLKYLIYSTLGLIPAMLIATFIGLTADDPASPSFILSLIVKVILVVVSLKYYKYKYAR
jgi:uncharacterized membrane protein YdjX (TVP38/TMEM64 family)